jgi:hypothetical protein
MTPPDFGIAMGLRGGSSGLGCNRDCPEGMWRVESG